MSHAGKLKQNKNVIHSLGEFLQEYGRGGSDFYNTPVVERGFETIGEVAGSVLIPVPIVGKKIGEAVGKKVATLSSYGHGLVGEIGGMMTGEKNIGDVLSYVPNRIWEDFKDNTINSDMSKVIRGEMNWRDAVLNKLEDEAMINILAPGKTHAWKDDQGNYHKEYVDGATMVVGKWVDQPNTQPRPTINSNTNIKIGPNGEVIRDGWA